MSKPPDLETPAVEQRRGGEVETVHPFSAVFHPYDGSPPRRWGPDVASYWRSSSKPVQLVASLTCLDPALVAALPAEDLALGAASHSGQPEHVQRVRALLGRLGVEEGGLRCGAHPPMHEAAARALYASGGAPSVLHNNCSGKHSFMLAAAVARGWDRDYLPAAHPLQRAIWARLDRWGGVPWRLAVDGCGVPTGHGPLSAQARTWAVMGAARVGRGSPGLDEGDAPLVARVLDAMAAHPRLMSGEGRLDERVVEASGGRLAVKVGAEGLFCVAAAEGALAVKVHSGNGDALAVAVRASLDRFLPGWGRVEGPWPGEEVRNVAGLLVGERRLRPGA